MFTESRKNESRHYVFEKKRSKIWNFRAFSIYLQPNKADQMKTSQEYIEILKENLPELQTRFGITSMRLFGSVARGDHHEGSDIDIFVTMPPKFYNYVEAADFLEELLGCDVDLISDHSNLRPFFRQQIEQDGIDILTAA